MKKFLKIVILSFIFFLGVTVYIYLKFNVKEIENIFEDRYSVSVLDDKNKIIGVSLNKNEEWHLKSIDEIPEKLKISVINFEDKDFYSHFGIDISSIFRALRDNIIEGRKTGASTITMQVAKSLRPKKRNIFNKYLEMVQAIKIERNFRKEEILKLYLNNSPYGGNIVGYKTASFLYFQKEPKELTWAEGALLAVLPNSPGLISVEKNRDKLLNKRNFLLKKLYKKNIISKSQYELSLKEPLPKKRYPFKNLSPHLVRRVINENDKKIIKTTIDSEIQEKIEKIAKDYSRYLQTQGIRNLSVLLIENKTYKIKSYIGSQDFYDFENNGQVDGVIAKRSPGSLLKPFLFAKSIDEGLIAPCSKVPDVPIYFENFSPQNANKKYYGMVEIQEALIKSLNVPFVQLLKEYGEDRFFYFLKEVLEFRDSNYERYGLSLILGTKEFTPEEMGELYTGLANYGEFKKLTYIDEENSKNLKKERFITRGSSYLTLSTIKKLERDGLEKLYKEKNPISWKTGTSHGRRDGWATGVTPDWTLVVWVGNFNGEGNQNLTGIKSAGNLLFNIMKILPKKSLEFKEPKEIIKIKVDKETGYRAKYSVQTKEILYPSEAKPLRISPYYKKIFVNEEGKEVDSRDKGFLNHKEKIILNYPIEVINFYVRNNFNLPEIFKKKTKNLKFIYPTKNLKISIPRDFDGEKNIIIKIANLKNEKLYWYLNGKYLGQDNVNEKKLNLGSGKYQLTIVSEAGENEKINFEIIKK
ncbi:penicillin-binding protein 1C [Fusobacterium sp.]|uniref:penicillin-binding protein 1C n=1 Tax=Fusobacterium sp. TaxID=68766 RepID=UPI00262BBFF8|nr:penicillin-binding protein 1C [Fusobacterium sp.]